MDTKKIIAGVVLVATSIFAFAQTQTFASGTVSTVLDGNIPTVKQTCAMPAQTDIDTVNASVATALSGKTLPLSENIKGQAISVICAIPKTPIITGSIQVLSMNPIEGGTEMYIKAWDTKDSPIGMGSDGTVEIEHVIIGNPRTTTPDGTFHTVIDSIDGHQTQIANMKQDVQGALLSQLSDMMLAKKQKFDSSKIIPGKIGQTTTVLNATNAGDMRDDCGAGSTATFAQMQAGTCAGVTFSGGSSNWTDILATASASGWRIISRGGMTFDGGPIPDTDTVSSSSLAIANSACVTGLPPSTPASNVYSFSPVDNTAYVASTDWGSYGTTQYAASINQTIPPMSGTQATTTFVFNSTGRSAISKTAKFSIGIREAVYDAANVSPTLSASARSSTCDANGLIGNSNPPVLTVESSSIVLGHAIVSVKGGASLTIKNGAILNVR